MKLKFKTALMCSLLLAVLCWQALQIGAQQANQLTIDVDSVSQDEGENVRDLLQELNGAELPNFLQRLFGEDADAAFDALNDEPAQLFGGVTTSAFEKAEEQLETQIEEQKSKASKPPTVAPARSTPTVKPAAKAPIKPAAPKAGSTPARKPAIKKAPAKPKKTGFYRQPQSLWRQVAFGFQLINQQDAPEIKMTETDKEIKAEGSDRKSFETKDAKGTRTQTASTRYIKDGKTFGVEIKNTQIIEAVSKPDGKSFRQEISMTWGAQVAACPDANGITTGTGQAKVISKTIYIENGETSTMISDFDLQAKLTGHVDDEAKLTHYDMVVNTVTENSGYEAALQRKLIKEIKLKDGRYGLHYDIPGNTIEVSDGRYGGQRTPARMGKATGETSTAMSAAESTLVSSSIEKMIPAIWNSANDSYSSAQRNWRNSGCVEVACTVPKTTLKSGEKISVSAETVHLQDKAKVNAALTAEAYPGEVSPESQQGKPAATFSYTYEGEDNPYFEIRSVSKRGIGKGEIEFTIEKEKGGPIAGAWTGTIKAKRKQREEREKRSGNNLAENGGHLETTTDVQLQLTGRLDRTVDANNAHIATVSGQQQQIDYEYDRYKVDEGYCGPDAVPYKGPKEITRTSTTTVNYTKDTRVYVEIDGTGGSITFSLPDQNGSTIHKYVQKSPCPDHDRANTNEAKDEDVPGVGGSFAFSFPIDATQKIIKGSTTVQDEDGGSTTYSWELTRG